MLQFHQPPRNSHAHVPGISRWSDSREAAVTAGVMTSLGWRGVFLAGGVLRTYWLIPLVALGVTESASGATYRFAPFIHVGHSPKLVSGAERGPRFYSV